MVLGQGEYCGLVILARLGVSVQDRGRGIGIGLLKDATRRALMISDQVGIRALLTHPIDEETARFYTRFGFEASPLREDQLLLLLEGAWRVVPG
jgi:predicted N-acetyltransferase YhbS